MAWSGPYLIAGAWGVGSALAASILSLDSPTFLAGWISLVAALGAGPVAVGAIARTRPTTSRAPPKAPVAVRSAGADHPSLRIAGTGGPRSPRVAFPPRPPNRASRPGPSTPRAGAAAKDSPLPIPPPPSEPPQFGVVVRMLEDIDSLAAEIERFEPGAARSSPSTIRPRPRSGCIDCAAPLERRSDAAAECVECQSVLCTECASDAAADGHPSRCDLCWEFEAMRDPSGAPNVGPMAVP